MKLRYAIVYDGHVPDELKEFNPNFSIKHLAFRNVKRSHFDTKEEAESFLNIIKENLENKLGMKNPHVMQINCYNHGESIVTCF
jgi:hypothetical protein